MKGYVASDYNVFTTGNITQQYTDIEGKLAAGGNVNFVAVLGVSWLLIAAM